MKTNTRDPLETGGNGGNRSSRVETTPARVMLTLGKIIGVNHFVWSEDNSLLHVYLGDRSDGIDASIPREHVEIVVRTQTADEEVLG